jgi:hypothetical protein
MVRDYELREALEQAASTIAANDPNPSTWLRSLTFLLQQLQQEARSSNPMHQQIYEDMLKYLMDSIHNRLNTGGW